MQKLTSKLRDFKLAYELLQSDKFSYTRKPSKTPQITFKDRLTKLKCRLNMHQFKYVKNIRYLYTVKLMRCIHCPSERETPVETT